MVGYLYSYNQNSEGGRQLAAALGIRRISHQGSRFRGNPRKTVINWGSSSLPDYVQGSVILNSPEDIASASNKLRFFRRMAEAGDNAPRIPQWTADRSVALGWLGEGKTICVRSVLQGHSGEGLIVVGPNNLQDMRDAPLYTLYTQKKDEYRVHIVAGRVIDTQRKALRAEIEREDANWQVRNLANGFVFVREDGREPPADVTEQALRAMAASNLTFGAVDVIYQERNNRAFVLEINTAPGLMNTTLANYAEALGELI